MNKNERFLLQPSQEQGFWVATDTQHGIVIRFHEHEFNDTQQVTPLDDTHPDAATLAHHLRELADWLQQEHYDKLF